MLIIEFKALCMWQAAIVAKYFPGTSISSLLLSFLKETKIHAATFPNADEPRGHDGSEIILVEKDKYWGIQVPRVVKYRDRK